MKRVLLTILFVLLLMVSVAAQATRPRASRFLIGTAWPFGTPVVGDVWVDTTATPATLKVCLTAGAWEDTLTTGGTAEGAVAFREAVANGSDAITVTAPASLSASFTQTLMAVTGNVAVTTGAPATDDCAKFDSSDRLVSSGAPCGTGSGTIVSGGTNAIPKYTGPTTIDDSLASDDGTTLAYSGTGGISSTAAGTGTMCLNDTNQSHTICITPGSNVTANRTVTLITGDADRSVTLNGDTTLSGTNTGDEPTASSTVEGTVELATAAETTTGTDATRAVTPDGLAGSDFGKRIAQLVVFDFAVDTATGDGKYYMPIPAELNGYNLVGVSAHVIAVGTTNTLNVDLARCAVVATGSQCSGTVVDMLSTNLTIDSNETKSSTAAAAPVIDTANDDVATDQVIRVDVDAVHSTLAKGLVVTLVFALP